MKSPWLALLGRMCRSKGQNEIARELGYSKATLSLVLRGKYNASTDRIAAKVIEMYGTATSIPCPVLMEISLYQCIKHWNAAIKVGCHCGNPETMKLHVACKKCNLYGGTK